MSTKYESEKDMATITKKVDDINGSDATETVTFGYKGKSFTIDLSDENADLFDALMSTYVEAATEVVAPEKPAKATRGTTKGAGKPAFAPGYLDLVRAWANANGYTVAQKGRVAATVLEAYRESLTVDAEEAKVIARVQSVPDAD
jgi:hypothetical protein